MKLKLALAIALVTFGSGALAQVNNEMTRMFNQRGNATAPGYVQGSSRGVITGGSMTIKNPIVSMPKLVDFQPPSVQAGCGGIDIQGGYLTLPSADQFVDVARAVAANAQGYAFKLALSAICDSCEDKMSAIQDKIQDFANLGKNSCELAQSILDDKTGIGAGITTAAERLGQALNLNSGEARDNAEAATQPGEATALQRAYADDPEVVNRELLGNMVWEALEKNDIASMLGASDSRAFREELMSLTGTVVACLPGEDGCAGEAVDGAKPVTRAFTHQLGLRDLLYAGGEEGNPASIYRCNDDRCLNPALKSGDAGKTITDRILEAYLGKDGEPGLIALRRMDPTNSDIRLTSEQRAAEVMAGSVGAYALQLAGGSTGNEEMARKFIRQYAEAAAAEFIKSTVEPVFQATRAALAQDIRPSAADAAKQLQDAERKLQEDYNTLQSQLQGLSAISQAYEALQRNAPQHLAVVGGSGYVPMEGR